METQLREQKVEAAEVKKPNLTGIPTQMKLDFEQRSGLSFDDVRVHYNSDKPARLGAPAYTQGTQIHVGPGHESSLPHELGHVIQQKAGRVRPTRWINGLPVNDQPELEREADRAPVQCMPAPALWGVVQMDLVTMPAQSGCNCGYHALARALLRFQETGTVTLPYTKDNLADYLTSYAVQTGFSVIGEAFDAEALAHVGEQFCIANHIPATCSSIAFNTKEEFENILNESRKDGSVILVPYFTGENLMPVINSAQEENAHWSAIDTALPQSALSTGASPAGPIPYKLYEGNYYGSFGDYMPPADVDTDQLFDSNQSIHPQFDWDKFIWDYAFQKAFTIEPGGITTESTRKNIEAAVIFLTDEYNTYRGAGAKPKSKSKPELPVSLQTKYSFIHSETGKQAAWGNKVLRHNVLELGIPYIINSERKKYHGAGYKDYGEFIAGFKTVTGKIEDLPHHRSDFPRAIEPVTGSAVQGVNLRGLVVKVIGK